MTPRPGAQRASGRLATLIGVMIGVGLAAAAAMVLSGGSGAGGRKVLALRQAQLSARLTQPGDKYGGVGAAEFPCLAIACSGFSCTQTSQPPVIDGDKKRFLVTGAAGFIGSHTAAALAAAGHEVLGIDAFAYYPDPGDHLRTLQRDRVAVLARKGVPVVEADMRDIPLMRSLLECYKVTNVIHLAAIPGVRYSVEHPEVYARMNIEGTTAVMQAVRLTDPKGIVVTYASSSSVYGASKAEIFRESDTPEPISYYALSKRSTEAVARLFHLQFGVRSTGLRFFTVYGPWGRPDMAAMKFVEAISKGEEVPLYGGDSLERDFTFVSDIVAGVVKSAERAAEDEVFNLGYGRPVRTSAFVEAAEAAVGSKARVKHLPVPMGDVPRTHADTSHADAELPGGYKPQVRVEDGMVLVAKWYTRWANVTAPVGSEERNVALWAIQEEIEREFAAAYGGAAPAAAAPAQPGFAVGGAGAAAGLVGGSHEAQHRAAMHARPLRLSGRGAQQIN